MVHFVGAGCGAVDLITVRGKNLIETADIIIYAGSLINTELLGFAKPECKFHNSAKMTLEEVLDVILKSSDRNIVRLHSGDPSIYGAIKEQMVQLDTYGIEYDICPGVSSLCGAAASLKAEYTLPRCFADSNYHTYGWTYVCTRTRKHTLTCITWIDYGNIS